MAGDGRVFPTSRVTLKRDVFRAPDCAGGEGCTAPLPAGGAVAQADPDRLATRFDPDGAAVTARGSMTKR
jgi:hypothetical protein